MTDLFDHAFLARQQATFPHLDVHVYAAMVREMSQRVPVRNPSGLLVHKLTTADRAMRPRLARAQAAELAELDRYAALWVTLLRLTATRGLGPAELARCLATARAEGYPKLNRRIVERLMQLGEQWPAGAARGQAEPPTDGAHGPGIEHREG